MMKWWGWGHPDFTFPMDQKPDLWPFISKMAGLNLTPDTNKTLPVLEENIQLHAPEINQDFLSKISKILQDNQISTSKMDRILHSYGKSYPDLYYARQGNFQNAPDMILYPQCHDDVEKIISIATQCEVSVVPFGGGTNIVGGVNHHSVTLDAQGNRRCYVTLNMQRMNRLLHLDSSSQIATIEAGVLGPQLEADLEQQGWSLGHYPDSFEFSSLGGWVATRSAGMQSDGYGRIEDMIVSLKMVTPTGTIVTRTVPASSSGPDLNRMLAGSEGTYGVITECTMRIHKAPQVKDYYGFLFPSFQKGVAAIRECIENNWTPTMFRLQDEGETQLALRLKSPKKGLEAFIQSQVKKFLKMTGYEKPAILLVGFEGAKDQTDFISKEVLKIIKKHRGFSLGSGVGKTWSADKFNVPYLRDYVMDYAMMVDVAETAAVWSKLLPVYEKTIQTIRKNFNEESGHGYVGCHISHTYKTGACLYFTYAAKQIPGKELEQYYKYKNEITQGFLDNGATLTHHHAVGVEHSRWLPQEISTHGVYAIKELKKALDPKGILNPGKLIPVTLEDQKLSVVNPENVENKKPIASKKTPIKSKKIVNETVLSTPN